MIKTRMRKDGRTVLWVGFDAKDLEKLRSGAFIKVNGWELEDVPIDVVVAARETEKELDELIAQ